MWVIIGQVRKSFDHTDPRVLDEPVVLAVLSAVADSQHAVVQLGGRAEQRVIHTLRRRRKKRRKKEEKEEDDGKRRQRERERERERERKQF